MSAYLVVLTAAGGVADPDIEQCLAALGGEAARQGDAAVLSGFEAPPNLSSLAALTCDANILRAERPEVALFIADMDSTMIDAECIDELADFAGLKAEVSAITERAMQGELDFDAALNERVALLKGLPETTLELCYRERITPNPGAETLVNGLTERGIRTALVSGGFTFFTRRVAGRLGFRSQQANQLEVEDGVLTGRVIPPILGRQAKLEALERHCAELGCRAENVVAIGDGANDLAMIGAAGMGVAYKAKPAVAEAADVRLHRSDLAAVLAMIDA